MFTYLIKLVTGEIIIGRGDNDGDEYDPKFQLSDVYCLDNGVWRRWMPEIVANTRYCIREQHAVVVGVDEEIDDHVLLSYTAMVSHSFVVTKQ